MADMNPSRLGQINGAGDAKALFLKVYGGEVLTQFEQTVVTKDKHRTRVIQSGKSAQFPVSGTKTAAYHTPGSQILGTNMNRGERVINVDDLLVASSFIANIDELQNHYDVRAEYSKKDAEALAIQYDAHVLQVAINAARSAATVTGGNGGSEITSATSKTDADVLAALFFTAAQTMAEKDVPMDGRYAFLKPAQYFLLAGHKDVINKDWDGSGSYSKGNINMIAGIPLVMTNNLPSTNVTADAQTAYNGNFSNVSALFMQREAVGTVQLQDIRTESQYLIEYQGDLLVSKYALGHGILRPECAISVVTA